MADKRPAARPRQPKSMRGNINLLHATTKLGIAQRTPEWHQMRKQLITASEALSFLGTSKIKQFLPSHSKKVTPPFKSKASLVKEKLSETMGNVQNPAMLWGTKYEPLAKRWYEKRLGVNVTDVGLMIHSQYPWLGASPDGLTSDGILLELKCPHRRKLHSNIPTQYWVQVQIQLEVMNVDAADYVECKFLKYDNSDDFLEDWMVQEDGKMSYVQLEASTSSDCNVQDWQTIDSGLLVPPLEISEPRDYVEWARTMAIEKTRESDGEEYWRPVYCCVESFNILRVDRDKDFFQSIKPILEEEWLKMDSQRHEQQVVSSSISIQAGTE